MDPALVFRGLQTGNGYKTQRLGDLLGDLNFVRTEKAFVFYFFHTKIRGPIIGPKFCHNKKTFVLKCFTHTKRLHEPRNAKVVFR
jgi:hypothetical protein